MIKALNIRWTPFIQGVYFSVVALWPLINIKSFMRVTGGKTDIWMVNAVSVLLFPLIFILFNTAFKPSPIPLLHSSALIAGTAGLMMVEYNFYVNGIISNGYLVYAILEIFFLVWWICIFIATVLHRINTKKNHS
ncbi:hypothetical protein [Polluticaenibacter yanchengensis]|uniref:Uncharacterized protein n=1 Tax=Polluticaenibacter yanchengensis TaxID=3014562 RepID=A0ABT4UF52_9BACT|nr:hypothetical protein [Chitinophagaceae bacterium LY-5]